MTTRRRNEFFVAVLNKFGDTWKFYCYLFIIWWAHNNHFHRLKHRMQDHCQWDQLERTPCKSILNHANLKMIRKQSLNKRVCEITTTKYHNTKRNDIPIKTSLLCCQIAKAKWIIASLNIISPFWMFCDNLFIEIVPNIFLNKVALFFIASESAEHSSSLRIVCGCNNHW